MKKALVDATLKLDFDGETPFIETRTRVISGEDPELPAGKVRVTTTPLLPPGASEEDFQKATTTEIEDDEHPDDPFHCEDCAKLGLSPHAWMENMQFGPPRPHVGRNDPCPCGSGRKYKRCCLLS